jgi:hypothetical protein
LKRRPELAHQQDVEGSVEFSGDLSGDWYSAPRKTENERLSITEVSEPFG